MLRARLVPCLLIHKGGLVKTVNFAKPKYVGDPLNTVRIFNEKEVDELFVVDIDASVHGVEPNYELISNLAAECRMPLCYGGGVKTVEQIEKIIELGVEKVALSSAAVQNPLLVSDAAARVGRQSVVVVIDVKRVGLLQSYEVVTHNGTRKSGTKPVDFARQMASAGAGEIVVNSVDNDGTRIGYDYKQVDLIRKEVNLPITILGGAGSMEDVRNLINRYGIIGAAAGSLFVLKGKYNAVLVNYPTSEEKEKLTII